MTQLATASKILSLDSHHRLDPSPCLALARINDRLGPSAALDRLPKAVALVPSKRNESAAGIFEAIIGLAREQGEGRTARLMLSADASPARSSRCDSGTSESGDSSAPSRVPKESKCFLWINRFQNQARLLWIVAAGAEIAEHERMAEPVFGAPPILERAFQIARAGGCKSMIDLSRELRREGYANVDGHMSASLLRKQLMTAMKTAAGA